MAEQICERCTLTFDYPLEGGQPDGGDYEGVPLCPMCYENDRAEREPDDDDE